MYVNMTMRAYIHTCVHVYGFPYSILEQLWSEVVQILKDSYDQLSKKKSRKSPLFQRLKLLARSSAAFFKGNGYGLSKEQIEIPLYVVCVHTCCMKYCMHLYIVY